MMKYLIFNFLVNLLFVYGSKEPIVEIDNGKLLGLKQEKYYSFYGIPFAEPPVGELRFESPKPYEQKWDGIREAKTKPIECVQYDMFNLMGGGLMGSEDCLFINVHTPKIETNKLLPVVFYIHGGGYMFGSGNIESEKYLMRDPKVLYVSFNYRLAILGFLTTGDNQISGNMGLKDQHLALKWVKANIHKFGGDPNQILMAGFSAGSSSVEYQLFKPETENLVQAAISFSGSALNFWALNKDNSPKNAIKLGKLLNCPTDTTKEIKSCLKKASVVDIMNKLTEFKNFLETSLGIFCPVVESKSVADAFITESPETLLSKGKVANVPWLASYTTEDGGIFTGLILNLIDNKISKETLLELKLVDVKQQYSNEYYANLVNELMQGKIDKATKYFNDHSFKNGIIESIKLRNKYGKASTYSYVYDNPAELGMGNLLANNMNHKFGTVHGDDVLLILQSDLREKFPIRDDEKEISRKLIKLVESFIIKGKPIYDDVELIENKPGSKRIRYMKIKKNKVEIKEFKNNKINTDNKIDKNIKIEL